MAVKTTGLSCLFIAVLVSAAGAQEAAPIRPRALLVNYDPILESRSGQRLHQVGGWNDPSPLTGGYISDLNQASHGLMNYRLTRTVNMDAWPIKQDGFRYTDDSYLQCLSTWSGWHSPDLCDYKSKCRDLDLARKVDSGEIDEVLDHSAPYFGGYETRMIGRGGYWCNSPALRRVACSKIFIISVFNYERGVGEMLEDYGHRAESILRYVYGSWEAQKTHAWNRFSLYDKVYPGEAACGNVHFAPNSQSDYDWGNSTLVWSSCDDWLANFPNLQGTKRLVNRADWGNGDIRQHHVWWFTHMPHVSGTLTEYGMTRLNNWWAYMQDFNRYPESNGDHAPGGTAPAAQAYPVPPRRVTSNSTDDWAPQINQAGRMVWHAAGNGGFDIFSGNLDGTGIVRITNDAINDEDPRINAAGRIVWQRFDGTDYEIFSANADGSNVVQITNNSTNDWHPVINDAGRIAWDRFDGVDYEIFSANADGSNVVQVTNNQAAAGFPREDVWPQINNAGRIVWFGYSGSNWEIYSADSDGANLVNVSNSVYEDEYPQISDSGRVVWHRWLSDSNAEIMSAPATGGPVVALSSNSYEDWYPQINSSDQVVWMSRSPNDWEIMTCPAAGGTAEAVTNNSTHDQYPRINDAGQIAWQGFDGHDWEIYTRRNGVIERVTNNNSDDRWVAMNGRGQMCWHADLGPGDGASTSEIYSVSLHNYARVDYDQDGDVDLEDFGAFQLCFSATAPGFECADMNFNGDGRVDLMDFAWFEACFAGPNVTVDPMCAG